MFKYIFFTSIALLGIGFYFSEINVHIIRHGEKIIAKGISDAPLTDKGKKQAKELGKYLALTHHLPQLYVSPMRRARQTADMIKLFTSSSLILDERLTEKNYRRSETLYPDGTHKYIKFLPNGKKESKPQHLSRLLHFLQEKATFLASELWIVAHGGLILRFLEKISENSDTAPFQGRINYCSIFTFQYNKFTKRLKFVGYREIPHADLTSQKN